MCMIDASTGINGVSLACYISFKTDIGYEHLRKVKKKGLLDNFFPEQSPWLIGYCYIFYFLPIWSITCMRWNCLNLHDPVP